MECGKGIGVRFLRLVCGRQAASSLFSHHSLSGRIHLPCCEQHFGEAHRPGKDTSCWQPVRNWGLQPTALWVSNLELRPFTPSWTFQWLQLSWVPYCNLLDYPSQNHTAGHCMSPDPQKLWENVCFKPLHLGWLLHSCGQLIQYANSSCVLFFL